ncbi:Replication protein A 70 kDa DNA-binding subunit A [Camellia lanceoleosa]|uniref:Replication protein A 70 kDa DNA-binding subunit A n=1 Tax=Camellia lanceoleosa TaxID=1840588 RepID=A0ACC0HKS0_9ERIC|nr:Replication protein A 70 kDa DNA-binding subunit A [Camellia lanceoleosa]
METQRRILNLKDQSGRSVELTLWGDFCNREGQNLQELVDCGLFPILAVKVGKVNDFSGKSIGTISSTQLFINPDSPEAQSLEFGLINGAKILLLNPSLETCLEDQRMRFVKLCLRSRTKAWEDQISQTRLQ